MLTKFIANNKTPHSAFIHCKNYLMFSPDVNPYTYSLVFHANARGIR